VRATQAMIESTCVFDVALEEEQCVARLMFVLERACGGVPQGMQHADSYGGGCGVGEDEVEVMGEGEGEGRWRERWPVEPPLAAINNTVISPRLHSFLLSLIRIDGVCVCVCVCVTANAHPCLSC
jgi:hypothetical protein